MNATYLIVAGKAIANRTTVATATRMPMTRRVRGPTEPASRSNRISSPSLSQNADPSSTMYSQVITDSSEVQPTGEVEEVAKDDLDDEGDEHDPQQAGHDVLGAPANPLQDASQGRMHVPPFAWHTWHDAGTPAIRAPGPTVGHAGSPRPRTLRLLDRQDLVEDARRPGLGLVRGQ